MHRSISLLLCVVTRQLLLIAMAKKKRKRWQWDESGSAAQPAESGNAEQPVRKARWRSRGSAAQPADDAAEGSAEQPVHPSVEDTSKLHASFAYLTFPEKDYTKPEARRQVAQAFKEARKSDLAVIHMAFPKDRDVIAVYDDIHKEIDKTSSVAQPASQRRKNLLSVWSEQAGQPVNDDTNPDPEREAPAICLIFDMPAGRISTINASWSWPILPKTTRMRLLKLYSQKSTETGSVIHIIGGELGGAMVLENLLHSLDVGYEGIAEEPLCALANSSDDWIKFHCFRTHYSIADAVIVQVWHEKVSAVDSDAHPAEAKPPSRKRKADQAPNSDEHPVRASLRPRKENVTAEMVVSDAHPAAMVPPTPLWDNLLAKLDQASSRSERKELMNFITEKCFYGKLCHKNAYGEYLETPMALSSKMEILLGVASERRTIFLRSQNKIWPAEDMTYTIPETDMKDLLNDWRYDVNSWMSPKNLKIYYDLRRKKPHKAQQMGNTFFSSYLHNISGCKYLLRKLIQLPIIAQCNATPSDSAEQPVSIMAWLEEFRVHQESDQYKAAVVESQRKAKEHKRVSKKICEAQRLVGLGKALSERAQNGDWKKLSQKQQKLVEDYDGRKLERNLKALLQEQTPRYKGFGVSVQPMVSASSAVQPAASSSSAGQPAASSTSAGQPAASPSRSEQ